MSDVLPPGTIIPPVGIPTSTVTNPATFRAHFPVFASATTYPDVAVQAFIDVGSIMLSASRWCELQQMGVELFTAHMLSMQQYSMQGSAAGVPGAPRGLMTNKAVSKVSVGYDYAMTGTEGWGIFNSTSYGQQLIFFWSLVGAGPYEALQDVTVSSMGLMWGWSTSLLFRWGSGG
jgi:hypothetical protein